MSVMDVIQKPIGLSEFQVAEIKKAFSICDTDGNGIIDGKELRTIIQAITDEDPTDEEFAQLMALMDKDGNGQIEWKEFLAALTEWFTEEYQTKQSASKRRKLNTEQERQEVHIKIKGFFRQFRKGDQFDSVRMNLSRSKSRVADELLNAGETDMMWLVSRVPSDKRTSTAKLEFLKQYRASIPNIPRFIAALNNVNRYDQMESTDNLGKMLSIVEIFSSPSERRAVADDIVVLFEQLVRSNCVTRLIFLLRDNTQQALQLNILRILAYFAPGPRIASTPPGSLLHPDSMLFKKIVISEGAMPVVFGLLAHPSNELREQAVMVIGSVASHNPECRDFILENNGLPILLQLAHSQTPVELLRRVAWCISILCGVTHPFGKLPMWEKIQPALQHLATMLFTNDETIVCHTMAALSLILPGISVDTTVPRRMVDLITSNSSRVVKQALETVTAISQLDTNQTLALLTCNLLEVLRKHLLGQTDTGIRMAICELLQVLAENKGLAAGMMNSGIFEVVVRMVEADKHLQWKFVKILKQFVKGPPQCAEYLVQKGVIAVLCRALAHFKEYDRVLTDIYKFAGPTFNFEFVRDILITLEFIINIGEIETDETTHSNRYAFNFDLECIDKMRNLLQSLKESRPEDLAAWKQSEQSNGETSIEFKVRNLLGKIKIALERSKTDNSVKQNVLRMIEDMFRTYFPFDAPNANAQAPPAPQAVAPPAVTLVLLKCNYGEDIRVAEIPTTVTFEQLQETILSKFGLVGQPINITYKDEDGDNVTIDSIPLLQKAAQLQLGAGAKAIKLTLVDRQLPAGAAAAAIPSGALATAAVATNRPLANTAAESTPPSSPKRKRARDGTLKDSSESTVVTSTIIFPLTHNNALFQRQDSSGVTLSGDLDSIRRENQKQVFEDLLSQTHFGKQELQQLYQDWVKGGNADGQVDRKHFELGMKAIGIADDLLIEQNFSAFDQNKDGLIDFREFVCGLSTVLRGDTEERLKFMFKSYDTGNRGHLTRDEVYKMIKASFLARGEKVEDKDILQAVEDTFEEIDSDHDNKLSFEEFKQAVQSNKLLINCSVHFNATPGAHVPQ